MSEKPKGEPHAHKEGAMAVDTDVTLLDLFNLRAELPKAVIQVRQCKPNGRAGSKIVRIEVSDELRKLLDQVKLSRGGI